MREDGLIRNVTAFVSDVYEGFKPVREKLTQQFFLKFPASFGCVFQKTCTCWPCSSRAGHITARRSVAQQTFVLVFHTRWSKNAKQSLIPASPMIFSHDSIYCT